MVKIVKIDALANPAFVRGGVALAKWLGGSDEGDSDMPRKSSNEQRELQNSKIFCTVF